MTLGGVPIIIPFTLTFRMRQLMMKLSLPLGHLLATIPITVFVTVMKIYGRWGTMSTIQPGYEIAPDGTAYDVLHKADGGEGYEQLEEHGV